MAANLPPLVRTFRDRSHAVRGVASPKPKGNRGGIWHALLEVYRSRWTTVVILHVGAVILLVAAALGWPFWSHYEVRIFACAGAAWLAWDDYRQANSVLWVVPLGLGAILLNPIAPIDLPRDILFFLDLGIAGAFAAHLMISVDRSRRAVGSPSENKAAQESGLEKHPDASLARARELAAALRSVKAEGRNPIQVGAPIEGSGAPQDCSEALKRYWLAAAQGDAAAQSRLGFMYHEGQGVAQDHVEALKWLGLAAAQGDPGAQFLLGVQYGKGEGVPIDCVLAHMWFSLAAAQGFSIADRNRDLVKLSMTPDQLAEAQRMAREWKPTAGFD